MMNGMMTCRCDLMMAMCRCEMTDKGCTITCTSGDAACCAMIQACCDCCAAMMKAGCTCCVHDEQHARLLQLLRHRPRPARPRATVLPGSTEAGQGRILLSRAA